MLQCRIQPPAVPGIAPDDGAAYNMVSGHSEGNLMHQDHVDGTIDARGPTPRFGAALLPAVLALLLGACGGGSGGAVRPTPPTPPNPPAPPVPDFTPTVPNDATLAVNPPSVPGLPPPRALPQYSQHLQLINAAGALGAGLLGQGVTIGLLDTGVNHDHPALNGRVGQQFTHVDPATNDTSVDDVVGHGTVVAEMAAGQGVGNWGGGVAQAAQIVISRIIDDNPPPDDGSGEGNEIHVEDGYGDFFKMVNGELADAGATIINNSWGGVYWTDPAVTAQLDAAWRDFVVDRGGLIVFANGNLGEDPRYAGDPSDVARLPTLANDPELEKGWLTVGALDPNNPTRLTSYSQQCGSAMNYCLVAPGNVVFIDPHANVGDPSYSLYQGGGTSYAAPQVAGAAAVVWSAFPYFTNDQVRQTVLAASKDLGAPGVDPVFGWGLLDVTRAAMGPSKFAWGDFSVSFSGTSIWRNPISGSGGLIKNGSGTLILAAAGSYAGDTRVLGGGLSFLGGLDSRLFVSGGASVWAGGGVGTTSNAGTLYWGALNNGAIHGDFTQTASGTLGVWLGNPLRVDGKATLAGTMSILGKKSGYVTSSKETLLSANGGVSGTFSALTAAPKVFLDASLSYDSNHVFLDINRIDVSQAAAAMGLVGTTLSSAQRVEGAMQALDAQLSGNSPLTASVAFFNAAGALQRAADADVAAASLRSLSGGLQAGSLALTLDALETGRDALDRRMAALRSEPRRAGGWQRRLVTLGVLSPSGLQGIGMGADGTAIGADWRAEHGELALGLALSRLQQASWVQEFGDFSRGHQREIQLYGTAWRGPWYAQAQLASGSYRRQSLRHLRLGEMGDAVSTPLAGRYQALTAEVGLRAEREGTRLSPYIGTQWVRLAQDAFAEDGFTGFGLRAEAWDLRRWQGYAGLRASRQWRVAGAAWRLDARAEWRQTLGAIGDGLSASFTGLEQWAPLPAIGLAPRSQLYGLGLSADFDGGIRLRFDLDQRRSAQGKAGMASVQASYRF